MIRSFIDLNVGDIHEQKRQILFEEIQRDSPMTQFAL